MNIMWNIIVIIIIIVISIIVVIIISIIMIIIIIIIIYGRCFYLMCLSFNKWNRKPKPRLGPQITSLETCNIN